MSPAVIACPCDEQLLNYNQGRLGHREMAFVQSHLLDCEPCSVRSADMQFWGGFMEEHIEKSPQDIGAE